MKRGDQEENEAMREQLILQGKWSEDYFCESQEEKESRRITKKVTEWRGKTPKEKAQLRPSLAPGSKAVLTEQHKKYA